MGSTTLISSAFTALLNCAEVGRRLVKPHIEVGVKRLEAKPQSFVAVTTENKEGRYCILYFLSKTLRQGTIVLAVTINAPDKLTKELRREKRGTILSSL